MLGLITIVFAYSENGLGIMLNTIIENAGAIKGHDQAPVSLKRRLDCFRAALRDVPALKLLREDGRMLATRFAQLGRRRNDLVHSGAINLGQGQFKGTLLLTEGRKYTVEDHRFDIRDAVALVVEVPEFCQQVLDFMARVDAAFES